jgi:predicted transposase/invertase (TIGR01784 family)
MSRCDNNEDMRFYADPLSDIFFRYLFGNESNKDILISFLNAVHEDSGFPLIKDVKIKNPYNLKASTVTKESVLDVKAVDETGRHYDIEVQIAGTETFKARSLYYWSKLYSDQLEEGYKYYRLEPVVFIGVLNFILFPETKREHLCFMAREKEEPEYVLSDHFLMHFLEVPKLTADYFEKKLHKWLAFLKYEGKEAEKMKILLSDDDINKAHWEYEKFTQNDEMKELYEAHQKWLHDQATLNYEAEQEGMRKGLERGLEQGLEKGRQQGIETANIEHAKRMKEKGLEMQLIEEITGLTKEEIEEL